MNSVRFVIPEEEDLASETGTRDQNCCVAQFY